MKDLIYKKSINNQNDLDDFEKATEDIIIQTKDEIKGCINAIAIIHVKIYAKNCSKCGKPLKPDECYDYCDRTHCLNCKLIEEEVDEECQ